MDANPEPAEQQLALPGMEPPEPKKKDRPHMPPNYGPRCPVHQIPMHVYCVTDKYRYFKCPTPGCEKSTKGRANERDYYITSSTPVVE